MKNQPNTRFKTAWMTGLFFCFMSVCLFAERLAPKMDAFIESHCIKCHDEDTEKGDFRVDNLSPKVGFEDTPQWVEIMERISSGEMPPEDEKKQPSADKRVDIVEWIAARMKEGEAARMAKRERVSYRRLTREEYVNSIRDLFGVEYDASDPGGLFEDPEWHGFERIGSILTLSPSHIEKYIKAAEVILDEAYPDKPIEYLEVSKRAIEIKETHPLYEKLKKEGLLDKVRSELTNSGAIYRYSNAWRSKENRFPGPGVYEFTYTVSGLKPEGGIAPRMQVIAVNLDRVLFEQDIVASEEKPTKVTFRAHFPNPPGKTPNIHVKNQNKIKGHPRTNGHGGIPFITTKYGRSPWKMKITNEDGSARYPVLIIDSLKVRGPIVSDEDKKRRQEYFATEENLESVRKGFETLARRAFRRPVTDEEMDNYVNIVKGELDAGEAFRDAVKTGMVAILCSKSFLFIAEGNESIVRHELNDWELANRLSYMLWSTIPDDELFSAAEKGQLRDRKVLQAQFKRMLADPRAERFSNAFASQWLNLRKVGMFPPDKNIYKTYDKHLEQSMIRESIEFFGEVLKQGMTLREFIDSDWTMLNSRLARFYGIPGVEESRFQRVALKPEYHRGGLLTQASLLSLTSDGTRHRPVHRGAYLSEVFLGKEPPPPPANVDPIEPNPIDAPKATLRMKLEAHKANPNCASCHKKIDPLGLAFENYNAIGAWRTHEKVKGTGADPKVDPSGALADGRSFGNAKEFQGLMMKDLDVFCKTFIKKLAIFSMRRTMTFDDREGIEAIAAVSREKDYRLRDLLEAFVLSDLFQKR